MLFFYFSPFWLAAFAASTFFLRYQVVVRDQTLTYGAFRRRVVRISEVIDFDVLSGSKSSELRVYLRSGKTLKFSGMLRDFDELVGMVNSHMTGAPGTQHDSPAKISDQEKRKRDNRNADRFSHRRAYRCGFRICSLANAPIQLMCPRNREALMLQS
jgi:hypothetical protein